MIADSITERKSQKARADRKARSRNKKTAARRQGTRRPIDPGVIYSQKESALLLGISELTLQRARRNGFLDAKPIGRYVRHSGQQLLDWLNAGGKTGWGRRPKEEGNGSCP